MIERVATFYYEWTPRWVLGVVDAPLDRVYRLLARAIRIVLDLVPRTGEVRERGPIRRDGSITMAGRGELYGLFMERVGAGAWVLEEGGRRPLWPVIRDPGRRPTLIEADRCYRRLLGRYGYVAIPEWVLFKADVSAPWGRQVEGYRTRLDDNLRRVRNGGFGCRIETGPDALEDFYHRMYVPHARIRYGRHALVASRPYLANILRNGFFLMVTWRGEDVAGLLISTAGAEPWLAFMGVRDGDFEHVRRGAISAMYLFALQWAHEAGHETLDVGHARPFRDDGLFRYKRRWGMRPVASPRKTRALYVHASDDPRVVRFLQGPVVTYGPGGGLVVAGPDAGEPAPAAEAVAGGGAG